MQGPRRNQGGSRRKGDVGHACPLSIKAPDRNQIRAPSHERGDALFDAAGKRGTRSVLLEK